MTGSHFNFENDLASPRQTQQVLGQFDRILSPLPISAISFKEHRLASGGKLRRFICPDIVIGDENWLLYGHLVRVNDDRTISEASVERLRGTAALVLRQRLLMPRLVDVLHVAREAMITSEEKTPFKLELYKQERDYGLDRASKEEAKELIYWLKGESLVE